MWVDNLGSEFTVLVPAVLEVTVGSANVLAFASCETLAWNHEACHTQPSDPQQAFGNRCLLCKLYVWNSLCSCGCLSPPTLAWFKSLFSLCVCAWGWWHMTPHVWRSEDNMKKPFLSFHMGPGDGLLVIGLDAFTCWALTCTYHFHVCLSVCVWLFSVFYLIF